MTEEQIERQARAWLAAKRGKTEAQGLCAAYPGADAADAYAVQAAALRLELESGEKAAGWKIAFTADAVRSAFGLSEPAFGYMLESDLRPSGFTLPADGAGGALLEPEIAFRFAHGLDGAFSAADMLAAMEGVCPAYELVRGRVRGSGFCLPELIADNASFGFAVLSGKWTPVSGPELADIAVTVREGEREIAYGTGAGVMGNPANAVVWLANRLRAAGKRLRAGDIILSGSLTKQIAVRPGDVYTAEFTGFGKASLGEVRLRVE